MNPIELLGSHVAHSIQRALLGQSYLDPEVLKIHGFATPTIRHLFSNLCHHDGLIYLEVGTFCGATFVAAFNNNPIAAVGIDNFSQPFDQTGVKEQLYANFERWRLTAGAASFIDGDAFKIPFSDLPGGIGIYYYDGEHSFESQAKALPHFFSLMADKFLFIVDDFQWEQVERGTKAGFAELMTAEYLIEPMVKIEHEWHLHGEDRTRNDHPIWWNGVALYLCSKV